MDLHLCCFLLLFVFYYNVVDSSESIVRYLPGFNGPLPFELETGYVSIGDSDGAQLFYYFIKSDNNPSHDPLLFWFTGGPGCSGFSAIAFENGPLTFDVTNTNGSLPTLKLNPFSWTKVSNIVFLDSPPGTGFSYSTNLKTYPSDTKSCKQAYIFVRKWLIDHPEFLSNPIYLAGDSYSGKTVPVIVQHISDGIEAGDKLLINFKGYLLGNPVTTLDIDQNSKIPFAHGMALISEELFESVKRNCGGEYVKVDPGNVQCRKDLQLVLKCTKGVNAPHILEPMCFLVTPKAKKLIIERSSLERTLQKTIISPPDVPVFECRGYGYTLSDHWANDKEVQRALHIRKGTVQEWLRCKNEGLHYIKDIKTSIGYHLNLSTRGYRSLIYSGDHDFLIPFLSTQAWIKSLNYSITDDWRPWFTGGQVVGYTRTYANNMTFTTIKGGGHTAPEYKPYECLVMLKKWLTYEPL